MPSAASNNRKGAPFAFDFWFDPVPVLGKGKDAALFVGVNDAVAGKPVIPCEDVEVERMPAGVAEAVCVGVTPAVFIGGSVLEGIGMEVVPPGRAGSVGTAIPVRVAVGLGVFVGTGVLVGTTGVLVGTTGVLVGAMGVFVGTTGVLVGTTGVWVGTTGVWVGTTGVLVGTT
jgi:hypothetical protein